MPKLETHMATELYRHEIANSLAGEENVGIELGVATGLLSKRLLETGKFKILFGVDAYADIHDTNEYKNALRTIGIDANHKLLRLTFNDALDLFPDEYFDFIYVDGFAHTGEDGGKTLVDWYGKLKIGGIMSGDDYHSDWPLVMWAVNHFASQIGAKITLTDKIQDERYSQYPTWFFRKDHEFDPSTAPLDPRLVYIAGIERKRIHRSRMSPLFRFKRHVFRTIRGLVSKRQGINLT
jgi:hypothetical protein